VSDAQTFNVHCTINRLGIETTYFSICKVVIVNHGASFDNNNMKRIQFWKICQEGTVAFHAKTSQPVPHKTPIRKINLFSLTKRFKKQSMKQSLTNYSVCKNLCTYVLLVQPGTLYCAVQYIQFTDHREERQRWERAPENTFGPCIIET
jgi:hypothetical protein